MLDTKSTFDDLVVANAATPEQGQRILSNRFYRNISGALSGTQESMAMEKLYELHQQTDFDLVVVDTAPTRNALGFTDPPRRLSRFLAPQLHIGQESCRARASQTVLSPLVAGTLNT